MRARPDRRGETQPSRRESEIGEAQPGPSSAGRHAERVRRGGAGQTASSASGNQTKSAKPASVDAAATPGAGASGGSGVGAGVGSGARVLAQRIVRARPESELALPADADERFLTALQTLLGDDRFDRYARGRLNTAFSPSQLVVTASSHALGDLLRRRFMTELHAAAHKALGRGIAIKVDSIEVPDQGDDAGLGDGSSADRHGDSAHASPRVVEPKPMSPMSGSRAGGGYGAQNPDGGRASRAGLIARYRLEDFLVGDSNRLAYNAALRLAESDPREAQNDPSVASYSMLFVHGPCGVGKSHLAHGVAHRFRERHPGAVVRVTSGEAFMSDFVAAIRAGSTTTSAGLNATGQAGIERFRANYRKVDLLCIDDVQALANKQATQAELLHTFEEIARSGARVVLVSDQHPRQLEKFSPQLISRFLAGMVAGIAPPDEELTRRLVRTLALRRGLALDEQAVLAVSQRARLMPGAATGLSVREIEGTLTRIEAVHRLLPDTSGASRSGTINMLAIERALGPMPTDSGMSGSSLAGSTGGFSTNLSGSTGTTGGMGGAAAGRPARVEFIIAQTCRYLSVDPGDLSGRTRHKRVVLARALITHLARQYTTMSFPEIARALGRPNHSTVITAYQRLAGQLAANEHLGHEHVPEPMTINVLVERLSSVVKNAN